MYFVILFSSSWQSDCVIFSQFKQQSLDSKAPSFACFRWLLWRTTCTLRLLNQIRPKYTQHTNGESPSQYENRINPRVYVSRNVRKSSVLLSRTGVRKISSVACGLSPIKIHLFWLPEKFNQQNKWSLCIFQWNIRYILFKKSITSFRIVCFAAITLVIVLACFLWCQRHVM